MAISVYLNNDNKILFERSPGAFKTALSDEQRTLDKIGFRDTYFHTQMFYAAAIVTRRETAQG